MPFLLSLSYLGWASFIFSTLAFLQGHLPSRLRSHTSADRTLLIVVHRGTTGKGQKTLFLPFFSIFDVARGRKMVVAVCPGQGRTSRQAVRHLSPGTSLVSSPLPRLCRRLDYRRRRQISLQLFLCCATPAQTITLSDGEAPAMHRQAKITRQR